MRVGSLFSGIGGLDLGLERAGMEIVWQVEIDPFCRKVLAKHWPDVPCYEDVREVGAHNLEPVDLICGGFPCQDISHAGKGAGIEEGTRSGLWFEMHRIIRELRPGLALLENVAALLAGNGLGIVLGDMAEIGYNAQWSVLSACTVGSPHMRERVFIVAYPHGMGGKVRHIPIAGGPLSRDRVEGLAMAWKTPQPDVFRVVNGVSVELDKSRIKALGNAVVPQVAEWIGRRIMEADPCPK